MVVWTHAVLGVLYACVLYFCICTCSAYLSMFHMERRSRNTLITIIIIIVVVVVVVVITTLQSKMAGRVAIIVQLLTSVVPLDWRKRGSIPESPALGTDVLPTRPPRRREAAGLLVSTGGLVLAALACGHQYYLPLFCVLPKLSCSLQDSW